MKKQLFQYAVILHEYEKPKETSTSNSPIYVNSKMIIEPKFEMARSEKDLVFKITREIPEEYAGEPDNVEIMVRNF